MASPLRRAFLFISTASDASKIAAPSALENVVAGSEFVLPVRRLAKNGFEAWAEVIAHHYEGLVAKEEASLYEAGPTRRWLKVV